MNAINYKEIAKLKNESRNICVLKHTKNLNRKIMT